MTRTRTGPYSRRKDVSEAEILKQISDYLDILMNQGRVIWVRHNPIRVIGGGKSLRIVKGRESQKGAPDIILWKNVSIISGPVTFIIETKVRKGKLSDDQLRWKERADKIGLRYLVCRSFDDFRKVTGL